MALSNKDGVTVEMVDMQEMLNDPTAQIMDGGEARVEGIPDLSALSGKLLEILEYLEQPEVKDLQRSNPSAIRMGLINKYADHVPISFINLFMEPDAKHRKESINRTLHWLTSFAEIKIGTKDLEKTSYGLVEEVNNRYAYSKYGSKAAFERALQIEAAKDAMNVKSKSRGF